MVIVIMGVAGAGKSTVGEALARKLGWQFLDGDDLHPVSNKEKMRAGLPLSDTDRAPWLDAISERIRLFTESNKNAVVACSLLKQRYREAVLSQGTALVYLQVSTQVAELRAQQRHHEFMPAALVSSQYADLEEPTDALAIDASLPVSEIVEEIVSGLRHIS